MALVNLSQLVRTSTKVIEDCLMPNGGLVAAPVHEPYYPAEAANYLYVWPGRDVGFVLAAMLVTGHDLYEPVLRWIWERAEDFRQSPDPTHQGLLFRNYFLNGRIFLHYLQPDQNGTLLWSIGFRHAQRPSPLTEFERSVVTTAANALVRIWDRQHFTLPIEDLWEERQAQPGEGILTYSLAACATGLKAAARLTSSEEYERTAGQMIATLTRYCWDAQKKIIPRRFGGSLGDDPTPDGSLVGLVWPFNVGLPTDHLRQTLENLEATLLTDRGLLRYPADRYEGSLGDGHNHANDRAGVWPLLTFWLSVAWHELGEAKRAERLFHLTFKYTGKDYFLPEQLFCCHLVPWLGVKPLAWTQGMALLAAWKTGKLPARRKNPLR